jgi:hypothetical protein
VTNSPTDSKQQPSLSTGIKNHIESEQLDAAQLRALMSMQHAVFSTNDIKSGKQTIDNPRRVWFGALATCLMVYLVFLFIGSNGIPSDRNMSRDIAMEVVKNHLKLKPLDVKTSSMSAIQKYFTHLDFLPISSSVASNNFSLPINQLLGGRYCSIQGVTAAQLRYQRKHGLSTLYEVAYHPDTFGTLPNMDNMEQPLELLIKGLSVFVWVEKGLLMVLVSNN